MVMVLIPLRKERSEFGWTAGQLGTGSVGETRSGWTAYRSEAS